MKISEGMCFFQVMRGRNRAWVGEPGLLSVLLLMYLFLPTCFGSSPSNIEVLAMVNPVFTSIANGWILSDPAISGTIVPLKEPTKGGIEVGYIEKMMRIYYPRTFEELVSYNFLFFQGVDMAFFLPQQVQWMYEAIKIHGLGAANTRSSMSVHLYLAERWATSILSEAFPNNAMAAIRNPGYGAGVQGILVVNDDPSVPPVMRPFKREIEAVIQTYSGLLTVPRPGCRILSWVKTGRLEYAYPLPGYVPHIFEWDYEAATTFTFMGFTSGDPFLDVDVNPFSQDVVLNIIWHGSHRELPEDPIKVHVLRDMLWAFSRGRYLVFSVFDFAERFGANTEDLGNELSNLDAVKSAVDSMYMEGRFDEAYAEMNKLMENLNRLTEKSIRLKDEALVWVYIVEWLSVTGISVSSGTLIWTLMVKRKLYAEMGITRLGTR